MDHASPQRCLQASDRSSLENKPSPLSPSSATNIIDKLRTRVSTPPATGAVKMVQADPPVQASSLCYGPEKLIAKMLPTCGSDIGVKGSRDEGSTESESMLTPLEAINSAAPSMHSVDDIVALISRTRITERKPLRITHVPSENVCLVGEHSGKIRWIQPSGPRPTGHGIEDEEQGMKAAETTASGGALLRITLLASGFVIGPSGSSVREICKETGADIKSWTDKRDGVRPTRSFVVEGAREAVVLAVGIICDAVDRYKELCEGAYCGQYVNRIQPVRGIDFCYQPPPRSAVPYAAALRGQANRPHAKEGSRRCTTPHDTPHAYPNENIELKQQAANSGTKPHSKRSGTGSAQAHQTAKQAGRHHPKKNTGTTYSQAVQNRSQTHQPNPTSQEASWPQIPPGYVLLPPNSLVSLDALQQAGFVPYNSIGQDPRSLTPAQYHATPGDLYGTAHNGMYYSGTSQASQVQGGYSNLNSLRPQNVGLADLGTHWMQSASLTFADSSFRAGIENASSGMQPASLTQHDRAPWVQGPHPFFVSGQSMSSSGYPDNTFF